MQYGKLTILLLLSLTGHHIIAAQQQLFTTYTVNDGLVHNYVRNIFQDTRGFIWLGTFEGLSQYDGYKFTNYTTVNGLSHPLVNDIFQSADDGTIYITSNDGGVDIIRNGQAPRKWQQTDVAINCLRMLPNNKILAGTDQGGIYEFIDGKFVKPKQAKPHRNYYDFICFNDSLFIAQSDSSIDILNYRYELFSEWKEGISVFAEGCLLTDSKKRTWLGTVHGLKLLSPVQEKGQPFRFSPLPAAFDIPLVKHQLIRDLLEDDAGNFWIGTFYGLVKIGADGSRQTITAKDGLLTDDVTCLMQDREKNIWVGGSRGVAKLVTKTNIRVLTADNGLLSTSTFFLLPFRNGDLIIGTGNGFQYYDRTKRLFLPVAKNKNYYSDDDQNSRLSLMRNKEQVPFLVFFHTQSDPLFFGPSSSGSSFALKDRQGNFFYPTFNGMLFSRDFINWQRHLFFSDCRVSLIDSKGYLWVGSERDGLLRTRYDYINDTPRLVQQDHHLPGVGIRSLYEDSKGYIWAGSRYHGVFRLKPGNTDESSVLHFDQTTGLTSNRITAIGEDSSGCIWLSFYHGLDKLVPDEGNYRVFNFSRFNNFFTNIQAMIFDRDHSLWLATTHGTVNITDGKIENALPLAVYVTSATLGDSVYKDEQEKKIALSYHHKPVQFEFAAPGFINEKQVLFSYRLLGSNNTEWSSPSREHSVSYASLQPGSYRFEVRTLGWNGQWGEADSAEFIILPPFWKTWGFIACSALVVAAAIYWLVKRRIKEIRKESGLKQKIAETEMMALRAQMNPHFIFNCLNAIDNLVQTNQKEKATTYLARFAKLIRTILDSSKNNVVPFQNDYESLQLYLQMEQFRCNNKFSYELTADEELLHSDFKLPPLIVQPFVENAIHHGLLNKQSGERKLTVSATLEHERIKYTITDNGVGRARAKELKEINKPGQQSYGINITTERIHLYNQNKKINGIQVTDLSENGKPAGTKVEIYLKIYDNH